MTRAVRSRESFPQGPECCDELGRILAFLPGLVFLAPALARSPAAVFDIGPGPDSRPRFSLFPLALAALDPLVWTSLWNSLAVATLATAASLAIGVAAGDILARSRFWGRPVFSAAITALAVVIPAWSALGFLGLFGTFGPVSFQRVFSSIAQTQGDTAHVWPWLVWVASALIQGVALVAVAARSAHVYVNSYDQDAARLAGARPLRIWWTFTWPALRPSVVSAAYLVFMINLADPAAPLVLGLRRTLGFQIVVTALGPDPFPRLAGIALMVLAVNLPGSLLVRWRRGADLEPDFASRSQQGTEVPSSRLAAGPRAVLYCVWLGCGSLLAWLPVAGLVRMGLAASSTVERVHLAEKLGISDLLRRLTTDPAPRLLAHSALLGMGIVAALGLLTWLPHGRRARRNRSAIGLLTVLIPPLVTGVSILALGRTALLGSRFLMTTLEWPRAGRWMEHIATAFTPMFLPGFLVYVGACLACLPRRLTLREEPPGHDRATSRQIDELRIAGSGRGPAAWQVWRRARAIPLQRLVLWATLAATAVAPALILGPELESRTIGPGIVVLSDQPDDSCAEAAALALAVIAANLLALGWTSASAGRTGRLEAADLA